MARHNAPIGKKHPLYKHGMADTSIHNTWMDMRRRCYKKYRRDYNRYGGRGIRVCKEWKDSFEQFYKDMGDPPEGHTLDRIDNDGNYCKENCKWSTVKEQSRNKRHSLYVTSNGITKHLKEWAEYLGIRYHTLYKRLYILNWSIEDVLTKK